MNSDPKTAEQAQEVVTETVIGTASWCDENGSHEQEIEVTATLFVQ